MPGPVFLEGELVELRPIEVDDVEFLQSTINDPRVRGTLGSYRPFNRNDEREWIESIGDGGDAHFLVTASGDRVGTTGIEPILEPWGVVEAGYMIAPDHWGKGYATDALRTVCEYAFGERRMHKVVAQAFATNPASRRVLEKVGFAEEGIFREEAYVDGEYVDVHRYGLLVDEFDPA